MLSLPAALIAMAITGTGAGQTVLLDFYSDACGPCRMMMPTVEQLAAKGYPVQRVNDDAESRLGPTAGRDEHSLLRDDCQRTRGRPRCRSDEPWPAWNSFAVSAGLRRRPNTMLRNSDAWHGATTRSPPAADGARTTRRAGQLFRAAARASPSAMRACWRPACGSAWKIRKAIPAAAARSSMPCPAARHSCSLAATSSAIRKGKARSKSTSSDPRRLRTSPAGRVVRSGTRRGTGRFSPQGRGDGRPRRSAWLHDSARRYRDQRRLRQWRRSDRAAQPDQRAGPLSRSG